ncbi:hypothetical protein RF11_02779 [Thelohanellus kitauei]|uniref:Uncharacterized protein n=1 Tax=Thelohanellus kitauei TaxID=669202 RepID=A0A0C2JB78_THEKT|nr:hypothetical protein RF11_02779 [Thelohanellus kitauei]
MPYYHLDLASKPFAYDKEMQFEEQRIMSWQVTGIFSNKPLKNKAKSFVAFSITIDESKGLNNIAQLVFFICGVDRHIKVARTISVVSDGEPQTIGRRVEVTKNLKKVTTTEYETEFNSCATKPKKWETTNSAVKTVNFITVKAIKGRKFNSLFDGFGGSCGLHYHTEIQIFMDLKRSPVPEFNDTTCLQQRFPTFVPWQKSKRRVQPELNHLPIDAIPAVTQIGPLSAGVALKVVNLK